MKRSFDNVESVVDLGATSSTSSFKNGFNPLKICKVCSSSGNSSVEDGQTAESIFYGELVVIGYNGKLHTGNYGKLRSKFALRKRSFANALEPAAICTSAIEIDKMIRDDSRYCIRYGNSIAVSYEMDDETDVFQIGRSYDDCIDLQVLDTVPGAETAQEQIALTRSTVSRYAARIVCSRNPPYRARLLAGAFDRNRNIIIGEEACSKLTEDGKEVDGFTRNGVLLLHPKSGFTVGSIPVWREISICGKVYQLRSPRGLCSSALPRTEICKESNILTDGCLIDLCGVTLMWRSGYGKEQSPTQCILKQVQLQASERNDAQGLQSSQSISSTRNANTSEKMMMFVNTECGHVQGHHAWSIDQARKPLDERMRRCICCDSIGPFVPIRFGLEILFHQDFTAPSHVFSPCGHAVTEQTARHWANIEMPLGNKDFRTRCPFCAVPLKHAGFVRIIFLDQ